MATFVFYNLWKEAQLDGGIANTPIDFDTDSIRLALVDSTYTPNQLHDFWADASGDEVTGTGYTANGEVLTVTVTETTGTVTVDATDATWS